MGAPPDPLVVVVAEPHAATRLGICSVLQEAGMTVAAAVTTAAEAVDAVLHHRPDVCLLDLHPHDDGVAAAQRIRSEAPSSAVVALSESAERDDVLAAVRAGARGYLLKDTDPERLAAALRGVLAGEAAIPRALVAHLLDEIRTTSRPPAEGPLEALSDREHEVLQAFASGADTHEVAARLGINEVTVRRHATTAAGKLGAASRAEAVECFRRHHGGR